MNKAVLALVLGVLMMGSLPAQAHQGYRGKHWKGHDYSHQYYKKRHYRHDHHRRHYKDDHDEHWGVYYSNYPTRHRHHIRHDDGGHWGIVLKYFD